MPILSNSFEESVVLVKILAKYSDDGVNGVQFIFYTKLS